jgi:hypothetical protein
MKNQALATPIAMSLFKLSSLSNSNSSPTWTTSAILFDQTILSVSNFTLIFKELWSPKEIALFNACICRFEKEFEVFTHYVSDYSSTYYKNELQI